jgi:hypothetical protein
MTDLEPIKEILPRRNQQHLPSGDSPEDAVLSAKDELVLALMEVGISMRKAESLVARYPAKRIRRQLKWLPLRPARRPASLLIAAIENDYDKPAYA